MSYPNAIEVCRAELFTKEVELRERYPQALVDKVLRVREMYNWFIADVWRLVRSCPWPGAAPRGIGGTAPGGWRG